jgi:hypothetical protein
MGLGDSERWQYEAIATSGLFKPICYALNRCPFNASFDRSCTIRGRVEAFSASGVPSKEWGNTYVTGPDAGISAIRTEEWLADPTAARASSGGGGHS